MSGYSDYLNKLNSYNSHSRKAASLEYRSKNNIDAKKLNEDRDFLERALLIFSQLEMIFVEGAEFTMGNDHGFSNEKPAHQVLVSSFAIGKYPVTQKLWETVMNDNPSLIKDTNIPVNQVSFNSIQEFLIKLENIISKLIESRILGDEVTHFEGRFDLPTEEQWEFAARGGTKSKNFIYAGSDIPNEVCWSYYSGFELDRLGIKHPPVGLKSPNELGIYDMSGNVFETCRGFYTDNYTTTPQKSEKKSRVYRGGSYKQDTDYCEVSKRIASTPPKNYNMDTTVHPEIGFRLVMEYK